MDPLQIFGVGLTLAHISLLAGVYFASAITTDAFVSTEIHSLLYFRVGLSVIVVVEAGLAVYYTYKLHRGDVGNTASASAFIAAAIVGWAILASYPADDAEHAIGAVIFISATAVYSVFFISKSAKWRTPLYALWAISVASAIAFAGLYLASLYNAAAACEWVAFELAAITLFLFFVANPNQKQVKVASSADSAVPLLAPLDTACFA